MSEFKDAYFAAGRAADLEGERLRRLDAFYAGPTRDWLGTLGLRPGSRILEAGAGSGGMLDWFSAITGPDGDVLGLDLDLSRAAPPAPPVRHLQADLYAPPTEPEAFDLVYARLVLMHLPDPARAISALCAWLKPGGTLAIADLDCTTCRPADPSAPDMAAFEKAVDTLRAALARTGLMDPAFGARLPALFAAEGLEGLSETRFERIVEGGSDWALFMAENNLIVGPAVGETRAGETAARFMRSPGIRFHDQTLVMVSGRKPARDDASVESAAAPR